VHSYCSYGCRAGGLYLARHFFENMGSLALLSHFLLILTNDAALGVIKVDFCTIPRNNCQNMLEVFTFGLGSDLTFRSLFSSKLAYQTLFYRLYLNKENRMHMRDNLKWFYFVLSNDFPLSLLGLCLWHLWKHLT
jgi:hypothetical protein